jgi:hypothetical protein
MRKVVAKLSSWNLICKVRRGERERAKGSRERKKEKEQQETSK